MLTETPITNWDDYMLPQGNAKLLDTATGLGILYS